MSGPRLARQHSAAREITVAPIAAAGFSNAAVQSVKIEGARNCGITESYSR
jgi:hypothetical protein